MDAQPCDDKYFVPLDTHINQIPARRPHVYPSTTDDEVRYSEFQYREEQKYFERITMFQITHILNLQKQKSIQSLKKY